MSTPTRTGPWLQPTRESSRVVVEQVFHAVHAEQFSASGVAPEVFRPLLDLQFRSQQTQYRTAHPQAVDHVIELDGEPVGRCFLDRSGESIRVLDIAILPGRRRRGIASRVLRDLQQQAGIGCVHLSVWSDDERARRLYDALGYRLRAGRLDGYLELCSASAASCSQAAGQEGQTR